MSFSIPAHKIAGVDVSAIGYGSMSIAGTFYNPDAVSPDEDRFAVLDAAYAAGCRNWDTADAYRDSEDLFGKWFKRTGKRDDIFLATKCGIRHTTEGYKVDGTPSYIKEACAKSLERLGVQTIDLYYLHRADRRTPIEHSIGALAELVKEGKVKAIGISGVNESTLRRAAAVHPIAALQIEYSPFCLDIETNGLLKACRELNIAVVAYSPLGRGVLTGRFKGPEDVGENDARHTLPWFNKENFQKILKLVDVLKVVGEKHSAAPSQVTLAWVLEQDIIPIPGTRSVKYLEENIGGGAVKLTAAEVQEIRTAAEACILHSEKVSSLYSELAPCDTPLP
ncbi:Aldo/keto reductase [Vararia minispora EC-137]|uniref:Aldo/keto reductase n=1 Tax=Vararia minispora EC-137 TaxID=1314806 RepID=A0ACB8QDT1_9AGAM|nr:Aldo/keto reductase [Vararia minispora EC-137]